MNGGELGGQEADEAARRRVMIVVRTDHRELAPTVQRGLVHANLRARIRIRTSQRGYKEAPFGRNEQG